MVNFATIPTYYHQCPDLTEEDDLPRMRIGDSIPFGQLPWGERGSATSYVCTKCGSTIWMHTKGTES